MQAAPPNAPGDILNSAISLFARKGYAGTGVQEILDAVGLSKPTLYYHFESKAGLFRAILDHAYDEAFRLMQSAIGRVCGTNDKLVAVVTALFEFTLLNEDLTRLVFATTFAAPEEIPPDVLNASKRRRNLDVVEEILREGQRSGSICGKYDVRDLSHAIFGSVSHRIRTYLLTGEGDLTLQTANRTVQLFLRGAKTTRR